MQPANIGNYFEDFKVGEVIQHSLSKTIFESDNNLFCLLTMNYHPVHTNADYASQQQHGKILVVGTLVFSLVVGFTVPDISGKAIANLDYEKIEHLPYAWHGENSTGDIIQRCTSDVETVKDFVSEQLTSLVRVVVLMCMTSGAVAVRIGFRGISAWTMLYSSLAGLWRKPRMISPGCISCSPTWKREKNTYCALVNMRQSSG